jgi:hypothetical protein
VKWLLRKLGGGGAEKAKARLPIVTEPMNSTMAATPSAKRAEGE